VTCRAFDSRKEAGVACRDLHMVVLEFVVAAQVIFLIYTPSTNTAMMRCDCNSSIPLTSGTALPLCAGHTLWETVEVLRGALRSRYVKDSAEVLFEHQYQACRTNER